MAVLAIYLAGLCDYKDKLAAGEVGTVLLIAPDKKQAKVLLDYAEGTPKLLLVCGVTSHIENPGGALDSHHS
jgi:hypothetical protein